MNELHWHTEDNQTGPHGKPILGPVSASRARLFWGRVAKTDGCWNWQGGVYASGYGATSYHDKSCKAHRLAWAITHGSLEADALVLHKCDNPLCCNPDHLYLGSIARRYAEISNQSL